MHRYPLRLRDAWDCCNHLRLAHEADRVDSACTYQDVVPVSTGAGGKGTWLLHCFPTDTGQSENCGWLLIRFQHCPAVYAIGTRLPQDLYCHLHSHLDLSSLCYTQQQRTHEVVVLTVRPCSTVSCMATSRAWLEASHSAGKQR